MTCTVLRTIILLGWFLSWSTLSLRPCLLLELFLYVSKRSKLTQLDIQVHYYTKVMYILGSGHMHTVGISISQLGLTTHLCILYSINVCTYIRYRPETTSQLTIIARACHDLSPQDKQINKNYRGH